ncbi:hypothetical protein D3C75_1260550 [compost metagenome]
MADAEIRHLGHFFDAEVFMIVVFNVPFGFVNSAAAVLLGSLPAALLHPFPEFLLKHGNHRGQ